MAKPRLTVSLRRASSRQPLAPRALFDGVRLPRRCVFLVHGYNTDQDRADDQYSAFERELDEASQGRWPGPVLGLVWPGDKPVPLFGPLYFRQDAQTALQCVPLLAAFIEERLDHIGPGGEIMIVAHSLGCLLATDFVKLWRMRHGHEHALRLVLMGAAIPTSGDYTALQGTPVRVLYSPDDVVLRRYFPIGQRKVERKFDRSYEAVGLHGLPADAVWKDSREWMRGYDHGDYWLGWSAADEVCRFLGLMTEETLPERDVPEQVLPAMDEIGERQLPG